MVPTVSWAVVTKIWLKVVLSVSGCPWGYFITVRHISLRWWHLLWSMGCGGARARAATRCHPAGVITITPGNCGHMSQLHWRQQQNQHLKCVLQLFQTNSVFGKIFVFSVLCVVWWVGGGGEWQPTTHLQLMMHNTVVPACHGGTNSSQGRGGHQYQDYHTGVCVG